MQARAAARNLQRDPFRHLQPWADQLVCPWLCPAQYARPTLSRTVTTQAWMERRRTEKQAGKAALTLQRTTKRRMATALAEQQPYDDDHQDPTPASFAPESNSRWPPTRAHDSFRPRSHSPIIINTSPLTAQLRRRAEGREVSAQWADDFVDVSALLDACLRLDRFERAATLVHHLQKILLPESPELLGAHNRYLRGLVGYIVRTRSETHLQTAQKWLELEIRGSGVIPNATTYALLLKASLQVLQGAKLERTIRRYMNLARDASLDVEVLHSPILSELEMLQITNVS
ncbi:MAG: hypothetical protein M1823_004234 [Watsoniomyces obsoletus]|nr:MAG: hypothetical protein M1823_004234 [Watsoniomyces obsoletus]